MAHHTMANKEKGPNRYIECLMTQFRSVYRKQKELKRPLYHWRRRYKNVEHALAVCMDISEGVNLKDEGVAEDLADLVLEMLVSIDYKCIPDKETLKEQILAVRHVWRYDLVPMYISIDEHESSSDVVRMVKAFEHIVRKKIKEYLIQHNPHLVPNGSACAHKRKRHE